MGSLCILWYLKFRTLEYYRYKCHNKNDELVETNNSRALQISISHSSKKK